jgi:hypothetical protein
MRVTFHKYKKRLDSAYEIQFPDANVEVVIAHFSARHQL